MSSTFTIKRGDTRTALEATLQENGSPVNLTGAVVKLYMRSQSGGPNKLDAAAVTITNAVGGVIQYLWQPADVDTPGTYNAEFRATFADGKIETYPDNGFITVYINNGLF